MKARTLVVAVGAMLVAGGVGVGFAQKQPATQKAAGPVELPKAQTSGGMSLTETLAKRRSVRRFTGETLSREQIAQLCWAAQGITDKRGHRTAPSAGATYPLRLYVAAPDGVFVYQPDRHALEQVSAEDVRGRIAANSSGGWMEAAGAVFAICGDVSITAARYKERAERFVWQETGHAAENLLLQVTALGLGATPVGIWKDGPLTEMLHLPKEWKLMYLLPVGVPGE